MLTASVQRYLLIKNVIIRDKITICKLNFVMLCYSIKSNAREVKTNFFETILEARLFC